MIESEGGKAIVSLHTTDPMCIPFTPPTVTAHPTWDGSFALRSRSGHFGFAVLEAGGLPFVWETPSGRFSVVCVLLVWVLFLRVQVWQFLLRWDPLFARLILLPRTLQPLLVIHTPPGLFYQVIRRWEKKKRGEMSRLVWGLTDDRLEVDPSSSYVSSQFFSDFLP